MLSAQPWFSFGLSTGGNLEVAGYEAYPFLSGSLVIDLLAITLVLYLRKSWSIIFLSASLVALTFTLAATLPGAFGLDLGVAAPIIEKSTGISSWLSQLETIILTKAASPFGSLSWTVMALLVLLHVLAIYESLKRLRRKPLPARQDVADKGRRNSEATRDLWEETNDKA